jgi:hypothetical protein
MTEGRANDGYEGNAHMLYGTKGKGTATVFTGGKEISARWSKADRQSHLAVTDASGKEIQFNPGKIWFNIQPTGADVSVK